MYFYHDSEHYFLLIAYYVYDFKHRFKQVLLGFKECFKRILRKF